jgi:signal recognition particle GTPase
VEVLNEYVQNIFDFLRFASRESQLHEKFIDKFKHSLEECLCENLKLKRNLKLQTDATEQLETELSFANMQIEGTEELQKKIQDLESSVNKGLHDFDTVDFEYDDSSDTEVEKYVSFTSATPMMK